MQVKMFKGKYRHSQWYYYLIPKRMTLKCNPPIYRWLCFLFCLNKEEYEKLLHLKGQKTFVYCPECGNELISSDSYIDDKDGLVSYKCKRCYLQSEWDFTTPVPILVSTLDFKGRKTYTWKGHERITNEF